MNTSSGPKSRLMAMTSFDARSSTCRGLRAGCRYLSALALIIALACVGAHAQGGNIGSNSSPVANNLGRPLPGVNISICQPLATTAASVTSNLAVLTMASNPITAGFVAGMQIQVAGFTGGDTYFNGGTFANGTGITGGFTILSVTSTTITYALTHANASATSNGTVLQQGNATTSCAGLSSIFSDPLLTQSLTEPIASDALGNWNAYLQPGVYYGQFYGAGVTTSLRQYAIACMPSSATGTCGVYLNGNNAWTGNETHAGTETFNGAVVFNGSTTINGANFAFIDPTQASCATRPGALEVVVGTSAITPPQSTGIANQCVGLYAYIAASMTVNRGWAINPIAVNDVGMTGTIWGAEIDMDNNDPATANQQIDLDLISGGVASPSTAALRTFTGTNNGSGAWPKGFLIDGIEGISGGVGITWQAQDSGLKITQSVTGSGSPQTVTTNVGIALNRTWKNSMITIDSGGSQENVAVTNLTSNAGTWSVTGIFTKNHANNTGFLVYNGDRAEDWSTAVFVHNSFVFASIQKYRQYNTSSVPAISLLDSSGVERISDYYLTDGSDTHVWRSIGTSGWLWQSQAGGNLNTLDNAGIFTLPANAALRFNEGTYSATAGGLDNCAGDSTLHALKCSYNNGAFFQMAQVITATSAAFATATTAGTCVQNTTAVTGATTSMSVEISPVSTPGVGAVWSAFVSSSGNVTINECAVATSAGGSIAFNIRVTP